MIKTNLKHLGIIMDGNRRWAKERFLPGVAGHKAGAENVIKISEEVAKYGISHLTLWALSTDNLYKRDSAEISALIKLIDSIETYLERMNISKLRFHVIGDLELLPKESQEILKRVMQDTKHNSEFTLSLAIGYGGQDEIIRATKKIISSGIKANEITSETFRNFLDTKDLPNPDLIIRTGGNSRHSGFLLFDSAYSEYYFTEKGWPAFDSKALQAAIETFNSTKRNFGK